MFKPLASHPSLAICRNFRKTSIVFQTMHCWNWIGPMFLLRVEPVLQVFCPWTNRSDVLCGSILHRRGKTTKTGKLGKNRPTRMKIRGQRKHDTCTLAICTKASSNDQDFTKATTLTFLFMGWMHNKQLQKFNRYMLQYWKRVLLLLLSL